MKDLKLKSTVVVVVAILFTAGICWLVFEPKSQFGLDWRWHYSEFIIVTNSTEEYTVKMPVPICSNGSTPLNHTGDLGAIIGSPRFKLLTTEHGLAMQIIAVGNVVIRSSGQWGNFHFDHMSMQKDVFDNKADSSYGDFEYWIYSTHDNVTVILHSEGGRNTFHESTIHGKISEGWTLIQGTESSIEN